VPPVTFGFGSASYQNRDLAYGISGRPVSADMSTRWPARLPHQGPPTAVKRLRGITTNQFSHARAGKQARVGNHPAELLSASLTELYIEPLLTAPQSDAPEPGLGG
jgi:hypothetical protein